MKRCRKSSEKGEAGECLEEITQLESGGARPAQGAISKGSVSTSKHRKYAYRLDDEGGTRSNVLRKGA
jgi:hypothetical protein